MYKKHYPPSLEDEVWRLEKIGKDGAFHRRLADDGIKTVQDFLKLSTVDPQKLKKVSNFFFNYTSNPHIYISNNYHSDTYMTLEKKGDKKTQF